MNVVKLGGANHSGHRAPEKSEGEMTGRTWYDKIFANVQLLHAGVDNLVNCFDRVCGSIQMSPGAPSSISSPFHENK